MMQLYTIHCPSGSYNNRIITLAYALMSSRTEEMYRELFRELNDLATNLNIVLNPNIIMTDFEIAAIRAEFQDLQNKVCNFHLCKSVWRHVQNLGLAVLYGTVNNFS